MRAIALAALLLTGCAATEAPQPTASCVVEVPHRHANWLALLDKALTTCDRTQCKTAAYELLDLLDDTESPDFRPPGYLAPESAPDILRTALTEYRDLLQRRRDCEGDDR